MVKWAHLHFSLWCLMIWPPTTPQSRSVLAFRVRASLLIMCSWSSTCVYDMTWGELLAIVPTLPELCLPQNPHLFILSPAHFSLPVCPFLALLNLMFFSFSISWWMPLWFMLIFLTFTPTVKYFVLAPGKDTQSSLQNKINLSCQDLSESLKKEACQSREYMSK